MPAEGVAVIYDGDCPLCANYTRSLRIRRAFGTLDLIDARARPELVKAFLDRGFNIDNGFVCSIEGELYYGADALNVLAMVSGGNSALNRINYWIFGNRTVSRLLYPVLRAIRNALLRIRGVEKLNAID